MVAPSPGVLLRVDLLRGGGLGRGSTFDLLGLEAIFKRLQRGIGSSVKSELFFKSIFYLDKVRTIQVLLWLPGIVIRAVAFPREKVFHL